MNLYLSDLPDTAEVHEAIKHQSSENSKVNLTRLEIENGVDTTLMLWEDRNLKMCKLNLTTNNVKH